MLYIGIDLGTSAVKLLMMDEEGNIQKKAGSKCVYHCLGGLGSIRRRIQGRGVEQMHKIKS